MSDTRVGFVLIGLLAITLLIGCREEDPAVSVAAPAAPDPRTEVMERTVTRFAAAAQLMPGNLQEGHLPSSLAPLILVKDRVIGEWGAVGADGALEVVAAPVIYYGLTRALISGKHRDQYHYHWWHRADADADWRSQGVRITVDGSGLPMVWEVLHDATGQRVLYVSEKLEQAARRRHGEPAAGYALARDPEELPDVVVARSLTDGPVPMGPWVYLESGAGDVVTLICRCMPSQASGPLERTDYRLVPWNELARLPDPWPQERADAPWNERLDGWLRWP